MKKGFQLKLTAALVFAIFSSNTVFSQIISPNQAISQVLNAGQSSNSSSSQATSERRVNRSRNFRNYNQQKMWILSRSDCAPAKEDVLEGISVANDNDKIYHLRNTGEWHTYNGNASLMESNTYYYNDYSDSETRVVISKDSGSALCRIRIDGFKDAPYVYKD